MLCDEAGPQPPPHSGQPVPCDEPVVPSCDREASPHSSQPMLCDEAGPQPPPHSGQPVPCDEPVVPSCDREASPHSSQPMLCDEAGPQPPTHGGQSMLCDEAGPQTPPHSGQPVPCDEPVVPSCDREASPHSSQPMLCDEAGPQPPPHSGQPMLCDEAGQQTPPHSGQPAPCNEVGHDTSLSGQQTSVCTTPQLDTYSTDITCRRQTNVLTVEDFSLAYTHWQGNICFSCNDLLYLGMNSKVKSRGLKFVLHALVRNNVKNPSTFLRQKSKSRWILLSAMIALLEDVKFGARHKNEKLSLHAALEGRSSLTPSHTVSKSPVASKANPNLSQFTSIISDDQLTPLQIRICGNTVHYLEWEQRIYLSLPDCLAAINKPSYLPSRGCKEIGAALERLNVLDCQTFIKLHSPKSENMRWIVKTALVALFGDNITFVRSRNEKSVCLSLLQKVKFGREKYMKVTQHFPSDSSDGENISSSENDADDTYVVSSCDSDETASGMGSIPLVNVSGLVWFQGKSSSYAVHNDTVFVDFRSIPFLRSHIESQGFRSIDKILRSKGLCLLSACITTSNRFQRTHIGTQALLLVLNKLKMCVSDRDLALQCVHDLKDAIILKLATKSASSGHRASPNKDSDKLVQFVNSELGSKAALLEAISQLLCNKKGISLICCNRSACTWTRNTCHICLACPLNAQPKKN